MKCGTGKPNMASVRLRALVDAAKEVCCDCARRGFPDCDMPLMGPNKAGNFCHHRALGDGREQVTLCAASAIWCLIRYEHCTAVVAAMSPRGFREAPRA